MIEASGIATVTLNMLWPYQRMIGMPRVAAIEHPFGRPYGDVGDVETQDAVLRAALAVAEAANEPGEIHQLGFRWHQDPADTKWHPSEPSPIIAMIQERRKKAEAETSG